MTIISNIGADLKNYRLQIINLWEDGEDCPLLDNPKDGDMVSYRSIGADGLPVVEDVKVYQNGEWVEQGGGGGGGLKTLYDGSVSISTQSSTYPGAYDSASTDLSESVETAPDALAVTVNIPNTTPFVLPYSRNNSAYGLFDGSDPLWNECPIVVTLRGSGDTYSKFVASSVMSASLGIKIQAVTVS